MILRAAAAASDRGRGGAEGRGLLPSHGVSSCSVTPPACSSRMPRTRRKSTKRRSTATAAPTTRRRRRRVVGSAAARNLLLVLVALIAAVVSTSKVAAVAAFHGHDPAAAAAATTRRHHHDDERPRSLPTFFSGAVATSLLAPASSSRGSSFPFRRRGHSKWALKSYPLFYNDFEDYNNNDGEDTNVNTPRGENSDDTDEDDDDDDEYLDVDGLGDWKELRRRLATGSTLSITEETKDGTSLSSTTSSRKGASESSSVCKENAALLETQCEDLAQEYRDGVWAHITATPEVGGLVLRMPLEAELFHGHSYNRMGKVLMAKHRYNGTESPTVWYSSAQRLVERCMLGIAKLASRQDGQIDASQLDDDTADLLQLYLDHQETWQEVCLVLEMDDKTKTATTLVLNRPMALKLTENLAQLVLFGADGPPSSSKKRKMSSRRTDLSKFIKAFGSECAVYIGGPDDQDQPAEILHGISNLPGAKEVAPNSRIYVGGLDAAVSGILSGTYKPMDFRFFVGRHRYDPTEMDPEDEAETANLHLQVLVHKYQPVACARSLVLKQCISLPKPLWHEVMELAGGDLAEISNLELSKRQDIKFQIIDDDDDDDDDENSNLDDDDLDELDDEIIDELSELDRFDDDEDDDY